MGFTTFTRIPSLLNHYHNKSVETHRSLKRLCPFRFISLNNNLQERKAIYYKVIQMSHRTVASLVYFLLTKNRQGNRTSANEISVYEKKKKTEVKPFRLLIERYVDIRLLMATILNVTAQHHTNIHCVIRFNSLTFYFVFGVTRKVLILITRPEDANSVKLELIRELVVT